MATVTTRLLPETENIELEECNTNTHNTTDRVDNISKIYKCVHCEGGTNLDELEEIIQARESDVNYTDEKGRTALHEAVRKDEDETVKILMRAGARLEFTDSRGNTALHDVYNQRYPKINSAEIFKLLFPYGQNIDTIQENTSRMNRRPPTFPKCRCHPRTDKQKWFDAATSTNSDGDNVLDIILRAEKLDDSKREIVMYLIKNTEMFYLMRLLRNTSRSRSNSQSEIGTPFNSHDKITSPFRRLIHTFPEVVPDLMNKCVTRSTGKVNYHFELLDDIYLLHTWPPEREHYCKWLYQCQWEHIDEKIKGEREAYSVHLRSIRDNHPLMLMIKHKNNLSDPYKKEVYKQMLDHHLVKALLKNKWSHFGKKFHIFSIVLYLIYLITMAAFVMAIDLFGMRSPPSDSTHTVENVTCYTYSTICNTTYTCQNSSVCQSTTSCYNTSSVNVSTSQNVADGVSCEIYGGDNKTITGLRIVLVLLMTIFIVNELYHIIVTYGRQYFKVFKNYIKWASYVALTPFFINTSTCENTVYRTTWQWMFVTTALFLAWVNLLTYVEKFEDRGMYVSMLKRITITFICNIFPLVVILLVAFALAFFCVRKSQDKFKNMLISLLTTSAMMADGFEYDDASTDDFNDEIAFVSVLISGLFLIIMTIIIMNLMIGVAVSDVQSVYDQAIEEHSALKIEHLLELELFCHAFLKLLTECKHTQKCARWLKSKFIQDPNKEVVLGRKKLTELPKEQRDDKELENIRQKLDELSSMKEDLCNIKRLLETIDAKSKNRK